jgi:hypothetical protein
MAECLPRQRGELSLTNPEVPNALLAWPLKLLIQRAYQGTETRRRALDGGLRLFRRLTGQGRVVSGCSKLDAMFRVFIGVALIADGQRSC